MLYLARFTLVFAVALLILQISHFSAAETTSLINIVKNSTSTISYANYFYDLAVARYNSSSKESKSFQLSKLQIIRVPKASSTSLSIVARRMVGCYPPGPCCKFPGEPAGTCPNAELADCIKQKKVVGCIGHHVDMRTFRNRTIPSISVVREPISRSMSAFFYPGMHHNSECTKDPARTRLECFKLYLLDRRFRNVLVKMLNGEFSYGKVTTCRSSTSCKHSLEIAKENLSLLSFVGVTEMWELSLLLLHYRYRKLEPVLAEFAVSDDVASVQTNQSQSTINIFSNSSLASLAASISNRASVLPSTGLVGESSSIATNTLSGSFNVRANNNPEYKAFKKMAITEYSKELKKQNEYDILVYALILEGLCDKLHKYKLWKIDAVKTYWKERSPYSVEKCS